MSHRLVTPYSRIVIGMTQTMKRQMARFRRRGGVAAVGAAFAVAMVFGPGSVVTARFGASEVVGHPTVSAADTITSTDVLAEVAAAGVSTAPKSV
jgi:hypothetical protein